MSGQEKLLPSTLYVVATPIGHLDDITLRAVSVLQSVDRILCEDTRHSGRLLSELQRKCPLTSLHEHNESERCDYVIKCLEQGDSIALISDAGTPLISDPGYVLVNAVVDAGYSVVPIPGVSAVITALSVAGLPTDRWTFCGFLPSKEGARKVVLEEIRESQMTQVFYESSHRIESTLENIVECLGEDRKIAVARELTKTFETILRGTATQVLQTLQADSNQKKGEFVLMIAGLGRKEDRQDSAEVLVLARELKPLLPPKKAAAVMASVFGGNKKYYYEILLGIS